MNIMCIVGEAGEQEEECFVPMMQCYGPNEFKESLAEIMSTPEAADLMRSRAHVQARRHGGLCDEIRTGIGSAEHTGSNARMDTSDARPRMLLPPPTEEEVRAVQRGKPAAIVILCGAMRVLLMVTMGTMR